MVYRGTPLSRGIWALFIGASFYLSAQASSPSEWQSDAIRIAKMQVRLNILRADRTFSAFQARASLDAEIRHERASLLERTSEVSSLELESARTALENAGVLQPAYWRAVWSADVLGVDGTTEDSVSKERNACMAAQSRGSNDASEKDRGRIERKIRENCLNHIYRIAAILEKIETGETLVPEDLQHLADTRGHRSDDLRLQLWISAARAPEAETRAEVARIEQGGPPGLRFRGYFGPDGPIVASRRIHLLKLSGILSREQQEWLGRELPEALLVYRAVRE